MSALESYNNRSVSMCQPESTVKHLLNHSQIGFHQSPLAFLSETQISRIFFLCVYVILIIWFSFQAPNIKMLQINLIYLTVVVIIEN